MRIAKIGFFAGCVVALATCQVLAQDWPQWLGPNRDGKVSGFDVPKTWPKELTQKWKVSVGNGDASPALVGGKLYDFSRKGGDEVISCLNADTGKPLWEKKYASAAATGAASGHPGPRSSIAVADGKLVALGVAGLVSCLDAASGEILWQNKEYVGNVPQFFTSVSPLIVDGMVILQLGGRQGVFIALDMAKGTPKWKSPVDGTAYASPVAMTVDGMKIIIGQSDKRMVALSEADGKLLWSVPFAPRGMGYNAITSLVDGSTLIYSGQGRGITAVKFAKKGDGLEATQLWTNPQLGSQFSTPVLKDGLIYGLSDKGAFFCLDAKDGKTAWTDNGRHTNYGTVLDVGPVIVALTSDSKLSVFQPTSKAYTEVAQIKVSARATYAAPVLSGKRLFVKDADSVALLTLD